MAVVPLFVDATACTLHFLQCGVLSIDLLCAALSPCVGEQQLRDSFPDYDEARLRQIERDFYRWFSDYVVETLN